jgi:hypothetical protein
MVCALCGAETGPGHDESARHLQGVLQVWDNYAASIATGSVRSPSQGEEAEELPSMTDAELRACVEGMPLSAQEKRALLRRATEGEYCARYVIAVRRECARQIRALSVKVGRLLE